MNTRVVFAVVCCSLAVLLAGCGGVQPPVPVPAAPPCELERGESTALVATGAEGATSLEWSANNGQLNPNRGPAVTYTAPRDYSGPVVITVIAKRGNAQAQGQMTCTVLPPPPTSTPTPTDTPTPTPTSTLTATPVPVACNFPLLTKDVFPQLANETGQFPIYGPVTPDPTSSYIFCEAVSDPTHSGPLAVHFRYEKVDTNSGWFGIATPNGYDASVHQQFCFWAYATQPRQSFRVKMKDMSLKENGVVTAISATNTWEQICTDISEFEALGINVKQMNNVNLGFEDPLGSAEIWVADFTFE